MPFRGHSAARPCQPAPGPGQGQRRVPLGRVMVMVMVMVVVLLPSASALHHTWFGEPFWSHLEECPTSKKRSAHTARRAGNSNVSPKSGVAAGGLAQGAMTQIAGGRTETHAA